MKPPRPDHLVKMVKLFTVPADRLVVDFGDLETLHGFHDSFFAIVNHGHIGDYP